MPITKAIVSSIVNPVLTKVAESGGNEPELVYEDDFTTGLDGWTGVNSVPDGSVKWDEPLEAMLLENATTGTPRADKSFVTVSGAVYSVYVTISSLENFNNTVIDVGTTLGDDDLFSKFILRTLTPQTVTFKFTSTGVTTVHFRCWQGLGGNTDTIYKISIYKL